MSRKCPYCGDPLEEWQQHHCHKVACCARHGRDELNRQHIRGDELEEGNDMPEMHFEQNINEARRSVARTEERYDLGVMALRTVQSRLEITECCPRCGRRFGGRDLRCSGCGECVRC